MIDLNDLNKFNNFLKENKIPTITNTNFNFKKSRFKHTIAEIELKSGFILDLHFRITDYVHYKECPFNRILLNNSYTEENLTEINFVIQLYSVFKKDGLYKESNAIVDLFYIYLNHDMNMEVLEEILNITKLRKEYYIFMELISDLERLSNSKSSNNKFKIYYEEIFKMKHKTSLIFHKPFFYFRNIFSYIYEKLYFTK